MEVVRGKVEGRYDVGALKVLVDLALEAAEGGRDDKGSGGVEDAERQDAGELHCCYVD